MDMIFQVAAGVFLGGAMLASLIWGIFTVHYGESRDLELSNWHYVAMLFPMLVFVFTLLVYR